MKYWNSLLKELKAYIPGEQPEDIDDYIKLNTNENPFPPSETVIKAIRKAASEQLRRYPDPLANSVRDAFAETNGLTRDHVFAANGSDEIFTLLFRGFAEKGDTAAFPYPSYSLYDTVAQACGVDYVKINLNNDFSYNMNSFLKKGIDIVVIASPNNPTGTSCPVEEVEKFLKKFKGLLIVDEAYVDFYGETSIELVKYYENIIVTRSFSKSYSLAGLRAGIAAANPGIIEGFMKIKDSYNIDRLAIAGAAAALKENQAFSYNLQMVKNNKEYLEEMLEAMGFNCIPSKANFIFAKHPDYSGKDLYEQLKERKILVRHFADKACADYIRISIGTMQEIKALCRELEAITAA